MHPFKPGYSRKNRPQYCDIINIYKDQAEVNRGVRLHSCGVPVAGAETRTKVAPIGYFCEAGRVP